MTCTQYALGGGEGYENFTPCKCPVCGGFLKWEGDTPLCNKCHTELIMLPEIEDDIEMDWGKICPISLPANSEFKEDDDL